MFSIILMMIYPLLLLFGKVSVLLEISLHIGLLWVIESWDETDWGESTTWIVGGDKDGEYR